MNAAGLGEMAAKLTAISDWYAAHLIKGEHYCAEIENLMKEAIDQAFATSEGVSKGDPKALLSLTDALYKSAVDMNWYGSARTGAGAEHHLTHYWVMRHAARGQSPICTARRRASPPCWSSTCGTACLRSTKKF